MMKTILSRPRSGCLLVVLLVLWIISPPFSSSAQGTAFTYQGFLTENSAPASGMYDLRFTIYDAASAGGAVTGTLDRDDVGVTNGLFTVTLDFGGAPFDGGARWLDIAVRPGNSVDAYTNLLPRQPITATPYAIKAGNAMAVAMGTLSDPSFLGTTTTAPLQLQVSNTVGLRLEYPTAGTTPNLVGGYSGNSVGAGTQGAVIAGGGTSGTANSIGTNASYSAIGGGWGNNIADNSGFSTISGGVLNDIGVNAFYSAIGGGNDNNIASNSFAATIAGGWVNDIGMSAGASAIGGGEANNIAAFSEYSTIAGGLNNDIGVNALYSAMGGGRDNAISSNSFAATIAGGRDNDIGVNSAYSAVAGGRDNTIADNSTFATIAGGEGNNIDVNAAYSAIGGGVGNTIASNLFAATIAGGALNDIGVNAVYSAIGGGWDNTIASNSYNATIAGGLSNDIGVSSDHSAIGGGRDNNISSNALYAVIPGGYLNAVGAGATAAFAAGYRAKANHPGAFVWADFQTADFASTTNNQFLIRAAGGVAIGTNDPAGAMLRVAGSIKADSFLGMGSTLMLGTTDNLPLQFKVNNEVGLRLEYPTVGTVPNLVGGYSGNSVGVGTEGAIIAGGGGAFGEENTIGLNSDYSVIGGGLNNNIGADASTSTIGGGLRNDILADNQNAAILGGRDNRIGTNNVICVVAGGGQNIIGNNVDGGFIGGGFRNDILSSASSVRTIAPSILSGSDNEIGIRSDFAVIIGGDENIIRTNARFSVIAGGLDNIIGDNAQHAFAAGRRAVANHTGTFVWADSQNADFASTTNNQFLIRAAGGVGIGTASPTGPLHVHTGVSVDAALRLTSAGSWPLVLGQSSSSVFSITNGGQGRFFLLPNGNVGIGTGAPEGDLHIRGNSSTGSMVLTPNVSDSQSQIVLSENTSASFGMIIRYAGNEGDNPLHFIGRSSDVEGSPILTIERNGGNVGIGTNNPAERLHVIGNILATGTVTGSSDRNVKENVVPVNPAQVLEKVAGMAIHRWNYIGEAIPHLGPMAQDFHAAFQVGRNDKTISMVDADGVALAAIQGLNQKVETRSQESGVRIQKLESENAELKRTVAELKQMVETILKSGGQQ